ncbi:MAG: glutamine-hydrolyzing carbamoyl-phosphate synthase small subunit, partial [Nitrospirota bacterium]
NEEDVESSRPHVSGFIVKELSRHPSNWRSHKTLNDYLKENNIVGIQGIDTRSLTKRLREKGSQMGIISTEDVKPQNLIDRIKSVHGLAGVDLVKEVTCDKQYSWNNGSEGFPVVVYDFGAKWNILRSLVDSGCNVTVVPASTRAEDVLAMNPAGIVLSNGPGDPEAVTYAIENVKKLIGRKPIFGICLGHQILGLALGGKTYKLKFGHHGGNQPVMDLSTRKVEITAQNHNFAVDIDSLKGDVELTHVNLNDQTVEGMRHKSYPIFSVQYHPEASPGPHDSGYLFDRFVTMMKVSDAETY